MEEMDKTYATGLDCLKNFVLNTNDTRFYVAIGALLHALNKEGLPEASMTIEAEDKNLGLTITVCLSVKDTKKQ